jgi:hypothetical protein
MARACDAATGIEFALLDVAVDAELLGVEYDDVGEVDVGEVTAAFCRLAPWALNAERKVPKNGLLVVGMLAICVQAFTALRCSVLNIAPVRFALRL